MSHAHFLRSVLPILSLGLVFILTTGKLRIGLLDYLFGAVSLFWEIALILIILTACRRIKWLHFIGVPLLSIMAFFWGASAQYFAYFGTLPGKFAIDYLWSEWDDALKTSQDGVAIWAAITLFIFLVGVMSLRKVSVQRKVVWGFIAGLLITLPILHNAYRVRPGVLTPSLDAAFSIYAVATDNPLRMARLESRSVHLEKAVEVQKPKFHTLLIVNESLRFDKVKPFVLDNHKTYFFSRAFSNSSYTHMSYPSLLSGVSPLEAHTKLHTSKLLYERLKEHFDLKTNLISAHSYQTGNYISYLRSEALDELRYRDSEGWPAFNNVGANDQKVVDTFAEVLKKDREGDKKFFTILHFNGTHHPYRTEQGDENYDRAAEDLQKRWQQIFVLLKDQLKDTVIIMTSDHGEALGENASFGHFTPLQPLTTHIPFIISLPEGMPPLGKPVDKAVSNIDILPTLLALYGLPAEGLAGQNLVSDETKSIPITNGFTGQDFVSFAEIRDDIYTSYKWERNELKKTEFKIDQPQVDFNWQTSSCEPLRRHALFGRLKCDD